MRVLSLVNQKGGCGKTTAAINLGGALAAQGERVLLVDLDPQAHATLGLGCDGEAGPSLRDVLVDRISARRALVEAPGELVLLPANVELAEYEEVSERRLHSTRDLRTALAAVADDFDYALLDCPARADSILTANALGASTVCLLVVEAGAFALQGAVRALRLFDGMAERQQARFDLRILGTMFDRRTRFARELLVALQARFGEGMFDTVIRQSVRLREAAAHGVPVNILDRRSRAAGDFAALAGEVRSIRLTEGRELTGSEEAESFELTAPPGALPAVRPALTAAEIGERVRARTPEPDPDLPPPPSGGPWSVGAPR